MNQPSWAKRYKQQMGLGLRINGGMQPIAYTGTGDDNRVQPNKPVMMVSTQKGKRMLHEGEGLISKPNGSFKVVPQKELIEIEKKNKMPGFQYGGTFKFSSGDTEKPLRTEPIQNSFNFSPDKLSKETEANRQASADIKANTVARTPAEIAAKGAMMADRAPAFQPIARTDAEIAAKGAMMADRAPAFQPIARTDAEIAAKEAMMADKPLSAFQPIARTPAEIAAKEAMMADKTPIQTSTTTTADTTTGAEVDVEDTDRMERMTAKMEEFTDPESPVYKKIANIAFGQLDPRLQTNMTLTAMQIAQNPNLTEGQKRVAMAQALRDAGIAQSELAADMAGKAMDSIRAAIGETFGMAQDLGSYKWDKGLEKASIMLQSGDIQGYADQLSKNFGINVDVSKLQDEQNNQTYNTGLANLTANIGSNIGFDDPSTQNILKSIAESQGISDADYDSWAREFYDDVATASSREWQLYGTMNDDQLSNIFRTADTPEGWTLDSFEWGGKTGRAAALAFLTKLDMTGGIGADGEIDYDMLEKLWDSGTTEAGTTAEGEDIIATAANGTQITVNTFTDDYVPKKIGNEYWIRTADGKAMLESEYLDSPNYESDARFIGKENGERVSIGEREWKKDERGIWSEVEPLSFDADIDDAFGKEAKDIIAEGETHPDYWDVVNAQATEDVWSTSADTVLARGRDADPTLYDKVYEKRVKQLEDDPESIQADKIMEDGRDANPDMFDVVAKARATEYSGTQVGMKPPSIVGDDGKWQALKPGDYVTFNADVQREWEGETTSGAPIKAGTYKLVRGDSPEVQAGIRAAMEAKGYSKEEIENDLKGAKTRYFYEPLEGGDYVWAGYQR